MSFHTYTLKDLDLITEDGNPIFIPQGTSGKCIFSDTLDEKSSTEFKFTLDYEYHSLFVKFKDAHLILSGFMPYRGTDDESPLCMTINGKYDLYECSAWKLIKEKQ